MTGHLRQRAGLKSRRGSLDPAPLTPEPAALVPFLGDCVPQIQMKMPAARRLREEDGKMRPVCATQPDLKRKKKNLFIYFSDARTRGRNAARRVAAFAPNTAELS